MITNWKYLHLYFYENHTVFKNDMDGSYERKSENELEMKKPHRHEDPKLRLKCFDLLKFNYDRLCRK